MALSRAYLAAHWLSATIAGVLLGTSCALLAALVAGRFQRRRLAATSRAFRPTARPPTSSSQPTSDNRGLAATIRFEITDCVMIMSVSS